MDNNKSRVSLPVNRLVSSHIILQLNNQGAVKDKSARCQANYTQHGPS